MRLHTNKASSDVCAVNLGFRAHVHAFTPTGLFRGCSQFFHVSWGSVFALAGVRRAPQHVCSFTFIITHLIMCRSMIFCMLQAIVDLCVVFIFMCLGWTSWGSVFALAGVSVISIQVCFFTLIIIHSIHAQKYECAASFYVVWSS